ncbi:MAG: hypothetical protein QM730_21405 [Anaerolineales bacterium]
MKKSLFFVTLLVLLGSLSSCGQPFLTQSAPTIIPTSVKSVTSTAVTSMGQNKFCDTRVVPPTMISYDEKYLFADIAGFKVHMPQSLPEKYLFCDTIFVPNIHRVTVHYVYDVPSSGCWLEIMQSSQDISIDIPEYALSKAVRIDMYDALLTQGAWSQGEDAEEISWDNDTPSFILQWHTSDFHFAVSSISGCDPKSPGFITKEQLIAIAKQLL